MPFKLKKTNKRLYKPVYLELFATKTFVKKKQLIRSLIQWFQNQYFLTFNSFK